MVLYEDKTYIFTKDLVPFDALDVKIRLYLNVFKDLGMPAKRVKKDIKLRRADVWVKNNGMLFLEKKTIL